MKVSVVIPARDEAPWLARLLKALRQWGPATEIVVADNGSTDGTRAVAASFGCRVVPGGRPGVGRNRGAIAASGDYLLFIDADVVPTVEALRAVDAEVQRGAVDVLSFCHRPLSDDRPIRFFYKTADAWFALTGQSDAFKQSLASFLLVSRRCFESLGGFDESLEPGEDVDFVRRAGRVAAVRYLRDPFVLISARRFSTERKLWFAAKTAIWAMFRVCGLRTTLLGYRWIPHNPAWAGIEAQWLRRNPRYGNR